MMKKTLSVLLSVAVTCTLIYNVCAADISTNDVSSVVTDVITDEELEEFLNTAVPVPVPESISAEADSISDEFEHTGSYSYDVMTGDTAFHTYDASIEAGVDSTGQGMHQYIPFDDANTDENILMPCDVVGDDNREKIANTSVYPWSSVVKLLFVGADGENYIASGFMIGPNTVVTAGHCVYNNKWGGWVKSMTVIPALNGTSRPYGSANAIAYECGGEWYKNNNNQDDWGIVRINANLGNKTGWMGLRWQSASYNGQAVTSIGYPASDGSHMYSGIGTVTASSARTLTGNWDLTGGQSGGPVEVYYSATGYTVLGINRGGGTTAFGKKYSDCLRIDEWLDRKSVV